MATTPMGEPIPQSQVSGLLKDVLPQGSRGDDAYLWLIDHTRRLAKLTDGYL